jgi:TPR repeat protein
MLPCAACARDGAGSLCGGCRFVSYCGAACQRTHWAAHKAICIAIKADAARDVGWRATTCDACTATLVRVGHRCSGCYSVEYCDADCQLAHWKREHKAVCKAVGAAAFSRKMEHATAGDTGAMCNVALAYDMGTGVAVDLRASFEWYLRAAEAGNVKAQLNIAARYETGKGISADPVEAFNWFRRAAESGDAGAQVTLAQRYQTGDGVTADPFAACTWFRRAAEAGDVSAQFEFACCYITGEGVAADPVTARTWYRRAAEAGHATSMWFIGNCYRNGAGITRDLSEARRWYTRSAEAGKEYERADALKALAALDAAEAQ